MWLIEFGILYDNRLPDVMETPLSLPSLLRQDIFIQFQVFSCPNSQPNLMFYLMTAKGPMYAETQKIFWKLWIRVVVTLHWFKWDMFNLALLVDQFSKPFQWTIVSPVSFDITQLFYDVYVIKAWPLTNTPWFAIYDATYRCASEMSMPTSLAAALVQFAVMHSCHHIKSCYPES